jgi:hypothetical protein
MARFEDMVKVLHGAADERGLTLGENMAAALPSNREGITVEVVEGTVLVTQTGDLEDHVLEAGDRAQFDGRGRVVALALTPSRLRVGAAMRKAA